MQKSDAGTSEKYARIWHQFWDLWRREEFFECHEVLEDLWRETHGRERLFLNGHIHCAVAIYQHRRGNAVGAARQLVRAQEKLKPFTPRFQNVEIAPLLNFVESEIAPSLAVLEESQRAQLETLRAHLKEKYRHFPDENLGGNAEDLNGCR